MVSLRSSSTSRSCCWRSHADRTSFWGTSALVGCRCPIGANQGECEVRTAGVFFLGAPLSGESRPNRTKPAVTAAETLIERFGDWMDMVTLLLSRARDEQFRFWCHLD